MSAAATVPLIPREILFGNPERLRPEISPDGKRLMFLAPDERNVLQVWVRTLGRQDDRVLTADEKRGIRIAFWAYDGEHLLYMQDADGDENWHLYAVNLASGNVRDLTPFPGIQALPVAVSPEVPHEVLVAMNREAPTRHDVYRVDLRSGTATLDTSNPGSVVGWTADRLLVVRAARSTRPDGGFDMSVRDTADAPWRTVRQWTADEDGGPVAFSADGATLYFTGNHDANARRLLALEIATGRERVLAEDSEYDLADVLIHPTRRTLEAVSFYRERLQWQVLDPDVEADLQTLVTAARGDLHVISRDLDETWVLSTVTDAGPVAYSTYRRSTRTVSPLFSAQPKLEGLPLAPMRPISYSARDGLTIHGYLTTPVETPARDLPTVLLVHGGPWGRDVWGFDPHAQWLANRGYAALQLNFRGSAGYGKQFLHAGDREWAGKMHDDLIDGVNWLVGQGIADKRRIAIMGGSYGGYAALVGLTFTPEVFAAGVAIVGPSSLVTLIRTIPPYWTPLKGIFKRRVGDVESEEAFLNSRSPLFFADRIQAPLLIAQGANDPRVKQSESEQIVAACRRSGKPVEYVLYTDEGHGFARPENRLHFYALAEAFLAKHLGGRCEPPGTIEGHSGVVRAAP
jgi:dipeptidyl aminopeptidase/acylaminoacyl peptidase